MTARPAALTPPSAGYPDWLAELKTRIHSAQQRAALAVNRELVLLYWQIGRDILERQAREGWGARVIERLASGVFDDDAPPARIHGDLWSGNVLWSPDGVVLIDPAAHGGHRITDLAMLALFGTPRLARIHAAYAEASDHLPDGWRDLIGLHQLHPLLVHADLFGGSYRSQVVEVARRYA